ncbi:MAG: diaminopimelate epimerase [Tannerellaceae bacterium]|nr:diaminopimelate epimerase [Tannerellaceae bacterium]MCD8264677.1 diaminopimelate epimerase [Tannerellaceae bacterium]
MTQKIKFTKMHGAGNDYIYVNTFEYPISNPEALSVAWSAPHTGIGSDGLVLIGASDKADFSMRIFNADGSEALMCGNATRCIGKYVYEKGLTTKDHITLNTLSGIKVLKLTISGDKVEEVTVDMGSPLVIAGSLTLDVEGTNYAGSEVSMGNPHFVIFIDNMDAIDLPVIGPKIENHPHFPNRTNVEFAQILPNGDIRMRVWERGSGITQACGTGACATLVAAAATGKSVPEANVIMDGGPLHITWERETDRVLMTGPATTVFEGCIEVE